MTICKDHGSWYAGTLGSECPWCRAERAQAETVEALDGAATEPEGPTAEEQLDLLRSEIAGVVATNIEFCAQLAALRSHADTVDRWLRRGDVALERRIIELEAKAHSHDRWGLMAADEVGKAKPRGE